MKLFRMVFIIGLLLVAAGCGLLPDSSQTGYVDPEEIDELVNATLTAIAAEAGPEVTPTIPLPEDVPPAWLEDPTRSELDGQTLPEIFYGLSYVDDAVWLVDKQGVSNLLIGQPANGVISPDGTGYLISSQAPNGEDILYYNIAADQISQWTDTPGLAESGYRWWPERRNVIVYNFVPQDELGPWNGYLAAKDISTGETIIIDDKFGSATNFALSPDGEHIAYLQDRDPAIYTWGAGSELIDMAAFGLDYQSYASPAWSPDGEKLAFHAIGGLADGGTRWAVVILDLAAGTAVVIDEYLSFGQRVGPELGFSPDGKWLASVNPGELSEGGQPVTMWVYSLTGVEHANLGFAGPFLWHPEGKYLLYQKWPGVGNSDPHEVILAETGSWTLEAIPGLKGAFPIDWLDLP